MAELTVAAAGIAELVRPRAQEIEQTRRLPEDLATAMIDAGLFRACLPAGLGGGADLRSLVTAIETVAVADGSAGWSFMIGATSGLLAGYLADDAAQEVFGDARAVAGGALAPRGRATAVDGGYRVEGRWPFGSGCEHCTWLLGGCLLDGGGEFRVALFPADQAKIHDTWTVAGLRGTGSHDYEVVGRVVPARLVVRLDRGPVAPDPLYGVPLFGMLAVGIGAVSLGIGRAALDSFVALAGAKTATGHSRRLGQRPTVQADVARAEADLRSARALLYETVDGVWAEATDGGAVGIAGRGLLRLAATNATTAAARATTTAYTLAGGTSVYADHPLQRHFRDAHVATQHMMVGPATWELAGKVLLGQEIATPEL